MMIFTSRKRHRAWGLRVVLCSLALLGVTAPQAFADGADDAAQKFNSEFDNNQIYALYGDFAGTTVQAVSTQQAFLAQISFMRSAFGNGHITRSLISTQSSPSPQTGEAMKGFMFDLKTPVGEFYEALTLINEKGNGWKMYGFYVNPAPPPPH